jgi:hypothetical protein
MLAGDEHEIQTLIDELTGAWKRGDAKGYGARFTAPSPMSMASSMSDARSSTAVTPRFSTASSAGPRWQ